MNSKSQCTATDTEAVITKYSAMVYRLAYSYARTKTDADDIFQEVFLRYIKNAPAFESEEHCKAWLIRVTINCAKRHFSSPWLKHTAPLEDSIEYSDPAEQGLDEALRRLPQNYRAVIHLFYYEGYSTDEIAKLLSRKPSTIRTQLTRARRLLGDLMEGE